MTLKKSKSAEKLEQALAICSRAFLSVGIVSCVINLLMLTSPLFMLQIYDRVLVSRSISTLIALSLIAALLYGFYGLLEGTRSRILSRIGRRLDARLSDIAFEHAVTLPLRNGRRMEHFEPTRDLDELRRFLSGAGPSALCDMPWMPIYLGIVFLFHPVLGLVALGGMLFLCLLTGINEFMMRKPTANAAMLAVKRQAIIEGAQTNVDAVAAMGMMSDLKAFWAKESQRFHRQHDLVSDRSAVFGALTKTARFMLQSSLLGVGAYLAINESITPGILIATSIITSRAVAPIEQAIGNWRGFVSARLGLDRLKRAFDAVDVDNVETSLPLPSLCLEVERALVSVPERSSPIIKDVSFALKAGEALGVIGPSGSGKSTLGRALVGILPTTRGNIRLDHSELDRWASEKKGTVMGYLPQDVQLFAGTVAQNIARFQSNRNSNDIIRAAQLAQAHNMIVRLPAGYDTHIGDAGKPLSGGQRQRIALARAFFGDPFLIVLDEPNAHLDTEGEASLAEAIKAAKKIGCIVIVIAHRPSVVTAVDKLLYLQEGHLGAFGPRDHVLNQVLSSRRRQGHAPRAARKTQATKHQKVTFANASI